jgi:hypothetical protein
LSPVLRAEVCYVILYTLLTHWGSRIGTLVGGFLVVVVGAYFLLRKTRHSPRAGQAVKLCTICAVLTSRPGSRCTEHASQSNRSRHDARYSTRAWWTAA